MIFEWYKSNLEDIKDFDNSLCVLSVGSCEQHSAYLPVGTDGLIGQKLVRDAAENAECNIWILPELSYGYSPHHSGFPGCITLKQDTLKDIVKQICISINKTGVKRILIVNSHGGNQTFLQATVNELGEEYEIYPTLVRYWDLISEEIKEIRQSEIGGMGHAGELETSLMMHYYPELVIRERIFEAEVADRKEWHNPDMFAKNKVYIYKPFEQYSKRGNLGQPQKASEEKGRIIAEIIKKKLTDLMEYCAKNDF